jgi:hypothetical protein
VVTDLGEQPAPHIQPAEPPPGGVDAVEESLYEQPPVVPDLTQLGNEVSKDNMPDDITQPDGTDDEDPGDGASEPEKEAPA